MASSVSRSMSVSGRPTDESDSDDMGGDFEEPSVDRRPPVASQLEETREGSFSEQPATPVSLAQTMPYDAGDVIANKYRLTKILGEGGMGAVWLARNLALEIDVAIKLIRHDYANAESAMRLLQEARAAARIGHPCIVRVFDFGTTERADPFIVMEVLQGESLAQTIARKGRLSAISAIRTLLPVAGALAAAHGKGIVHRDLKPDNIRLVTDDRGGVIPKVVDFGIAKLHHDDTPRETTQAGVILGSPHYMSPEQACGRSDVDHRTDVWAFSVMLYEVITGKRPFEGPNYNALISSILVFQPAPMDQHDVHEPELAALIQKGLAKEHQDRWQSMQEYGEALALWAAQRDVETDAAGNSLRAHWLVANMQRPLSEFPPSNGSPPEPGRPRMVSERDIRIGALPSLSAFAIPEFVETNDPPADASPMEDPAPPVVTPPASPSATTTAKSPNKNQNSHALWIGPLALAVGAIVAGAIILTMREEPKAPETRLATASSTNLATTDKPAQPANVVPLPNVVTANSAAPEQGPVVPVASVVSSAAPPASAEATASAHPSARSTVHVVAPVVAPKASTKTPPPIPTDPNF